MRPAADRELVPADLMLDVRDLGRQRLVLRHPTGRAATANPTANRDVTVLPARFPVARTASLSAVVGDAVLVRGAIEEAAGEKSLVRMTTMDDVRRLSGG